ncbi:hypothetical protein EKPJFOCH_3861 [Methylobacterium thuringiense]|uniref:Ribbon-helix-helix protein CopG domain-containing protein n=1 Tax=Methylobacterium thuringiense TaxID=1003091 RepID=A0ABQ4TRL9_9HYPH|nr:hypothetical protein EKPJFOCH_3861 [Methylobacterium thuringiense]
MRSGTLSRTRIFRADPALDAAIAAAAEREETSASDWIRRALASVAKSACPSSLGVTHTRAGDAAAIAAHG